MKPAIFSKKTILIILSVALGTVLLVTLLVTTMVNARLQSLEQNIRLAIADQESTLVAIAEITARNGADTTTESIIKDCTTAERGEFDDLLGRLNSGPSRTELVTLERLFGRCGAFYASRKAIMVARLSREIEVYTTYVTQLSAIRNDDLGTDFKVARWDALATEERKQSQLFAELVTLQDQIISTLLSGKSPDSPEMQEILQQAREVQETLMVANKQTAVIRAELISL